MLYTLKNVLFDLRHPVHYKEHPGILASASSLPVRVIHLRRTTTYIHTHRASFDQTHVQDKRIPVLYIAKKLSETDNIHEKRKI